MKLLKTAYKFSLSQQRDNICVNSIEAGQFLFKNDSVQYIAYSDGIEPYRQFKYNGNWYKDFVTDRIQYYSYLPYKNRQIVLKNESGKDLDIAPEKVYCIINNLDFQSDDLYAAIISDFPCKWEDSIAWYDAAKDEFKSTQIDLFGCTYRNRNFYGFDKVQDQFIKVDLSFKTVWSFQLDFSPKTPIESHIYNNFVIHFFGPKEEERVVEGGLPKYTCSGGRLYGLNDADGSVAWQLDMPNSMDGYELVGDILYAVSLNEIFLINPETGEIKHTLDTETSTPFNRDLKPTITIDQKFIYYTHYDDAVILVYDVNTLEQVRRIDMPEGYYPKEHNFHDVITGKQYFTIHNKTQYVAQWPVLEIDPNDIDSPVEFEQEPDMSIELLPAEGNNQEKEVVIKLQSESLDDALRFGEIYTRDEAQRYSHNFMNMTFMGRPFAPEQNFNGIVRFVYTGSKEDETKVKEHLEIMEKRFEKWVEKEGFFACTDTSQSTRLIAEYRM